MESLLLRCQYVILPGKLKHECQYRDLYNDAYAFWKEYWQRMFKAKAPGFWNPLDFFRQDLVYCLFYDGKIAAQNLSMFAHADDLITPDIPYFASFDGQPNAMIKAESAKKIMTIEYTAVHSSYGERRTGVRFAEVMNGLALYAFNQLDFDVTTGTPRRLSGLSKVTEGYGYRKLGEGCKKAGWDLDVFLGFKGEICEHPEPTYKDIIRALWEQRVDYSDIEHISSAAKRDHRSSARKGAQMKVEGIREVYAESMAELGVRFDSIDWTNKEAYGLWLSQAYFLVRHTTRLLALCAGYCPFEYEETHRRTLEHLREETGHDAIAVADLKSLGFDLDELTEMPETSALIQLQYRQMAEMSGCAFFGYILLLEGLAVTRGGLLHAVVGDKFGPRASRFLKTHAEDDVEHIEKAFQHIDLFKPNDQMIVVRNLRESSRLYGLMLDHVKKDIAEFRQGAFVTQVHSESGVAEV